MGQTKALMEKVMVAKSRSLSSTETLLCATRYGNVMVSRGSVIPLFVSQIKAGKPLTITDPNMTRFLMSLDDSVDLVLHAYGHGQQGDIFVQKAPAASIGDLVQALRELLRRDNEIRIIGTRHGEKLYESLVSREEMAARRRPGRLLPHSRRFARPELRQVLRRGPDRHLRASTTTRRTTRSASTSSRSSRC